MFYENIRLKDIDGLFLKSSKDSTAKIADSSSKRMFSVKNLPGDFFIDWRWFQ